MTDITNQEIRDLALQCGFTLRPQADGTEDLNPYVYDFARAMARRGRLPNLRPMMGEMPVLAVDFDGVLHSYQRGWQGARIIKDPPVAGAMQFLSDATDEFVVCIYSTRNAQPGGIEAMKDYLKHHLVEHWHAMPDIGERIFHKLQFPMDKPSAKVTLDDRAIRFNGEFPSIRSLLAFKSWNER